MSVFKSLRSQVLLVGVLTTLSLYTNCSPGFVSGAGGSNTQASLAEPLNPDLVQGKTLYAQNCASCHGDLATSLKVGKSLSDIENAIANQPSMASLRILSSADLSSIAIALNAPATVDTSSVASSFNPVISNRYQMSSRLTALFVADVSPTTDDTKIQTAITTYVSGHPEAFGGNCSRNDEGCIARACGLSGANCLGFLATSQDADPMPAAGSVRKGYGVQVCEQILSVDKAVTNLLAKASLSATAAPSVGSISTLLGFVYPGQPISNDVTAKLLAVAAAASSNAMTPLDQWRFVVLPVCESDQMDFL